jgi:Ca-activated chloride channel family protein
MEINLGLPISGIVSPSHAIKVKLDEDKTANVSLQDEVTELDRDFVLQIRLGHEPMPTVQSVKGPGDHTFVAVTLQPQFDELDETPAQAGEVFFVLDCSGSMRGDSIVQARRALELCLRSLSEGDRFNICRFGSGFEMMNRELLTYSQETH